MGHQASDACQRSWCINYVNAEKSPPQGSGGQNTLAQDAQILAEQNFAARFLEADVALHSTRHHEVESETVWDSLYGDPFGAAPTVLHSSPGLAEALVRDEPGSAKDHAPDYQRLTSEDESRIAAFWSVYAGHELNVWCRTLNALGGRGAAKEQQGGESDSSHSTHPLERLALERIEFFFRKLYDATGRVHLEEFLRQLDRLVNRQERKQHLRNALSDLQLADH
jgi:hypothetical protein